MPDDAVPADIPDRPIETLDDPTEDLDRSTHSVAELAQTEPHGVGFDVPTEPIDWTRSVQDTEPL
jgi:hypothetical protein